jgi:hypothetical protein
MSEIILHVNRHRILGNRKAKTKEPPLAVRRGRTGKACYADRVDLLDRFGQIAASLVYTPDRPLKCGAEVYLVVNNEELSVRPYNGQTG